MAMEYGDSTANYCWTMLSPKQKTAVLFNQEGGMPRLMSLPSTNEELKAMSRDEVGLRSTVRLRFRKSILGHNFQTIRKLVINYFQYHREVIYII